MRNTSQGFTLIELLIVIAVIGLLAAVLISNVMGAQKRAFDTKAIACARSLVKAAVVYRMDNNTTAYPQADFFDGTLASREEYDTANCENLQITSQASMQDFTYTIKHPQGANTYVATLTGVTIQP